MEGAKIARGSFRGFRRVGLAAGRVLLRIVRLDDQIKSSIRRRILDRKIEEACRDLGEFVTLHMVDGPMNEGDQVLLDLLRTEVLRLSEEKRLVGPEPGERPLRGKKTVPGKEVG